jgi:hypothetical protein
LDAKSHKNQSMVLGGAKMDAIPTEPLTWMTFHRMRFHKGIDANECRFVL